MKGIIMRSTATLADMESGLDWKMQRDIKNNHIICTRNSTYPIERIIIKKTVNEDKNISFRITIEVNQELFITDKTPGNFPYEFINSFYEKAGDKVQRGTVFECNWFLNTYDAKNVSPDIAHAIMSTIHEHVPFFKTDINTIFNFLNSLTPQYEQARLFTPATSLNQNMTKNPEQDTTPDATPHHNSPR